MEHHIAGYGPVENAAIVFKWVMIWLMACGIPLALSMALPKWVKTDEKPNHHH
jgi:hypothetical protein